MMKSCFLRTGWGLLVFTATVAAQPSAFTYQGRLTDDNRVAHGEYDLRFALYAVAAGGAPVGPILTNAAVAVVDGLFTTTLDFGEGAFDGAERWLEIGIRAAGDSAFAVVAPPVL